MYTLKGKIDQDNFIREYLPIVRRQALLLHARLPSSVELDDLIQAGLVGLMDALSRFDVAAGTSFLTFASHRVRGAMIDELRTFDWVPRSVRREARALEDCVHQLEQRLGRPPEEQEVAKALNMSLEEYWRLLVDSNNGYLLPLEELIEEGHEAAMGEDQRPDPFSSLQDRQLRDRLMHFIDELPEREKQLLMLYYQEELNQKEIGLVMGVTESRVSQLHSQAVARLRAKLKQDAA